MADANQLRDRICTGFKRYYESQGKEYDRIFTIFCEENGYDDDEMIEGEMGDQVELEDCPLTDFDGDFPVPKGQNKEEFIYTLIQKIIDDPDITFDDDSFITFDNEFYDVEEKEIQEIEQLYSTQCPVLWNSGMQTEQGLIRLLTVGRRHNIDYVTYCVDDYSRTRVENIGGKSLKESDWSTRSRHVKKLQSDGTIMKNFLAQDGDKKLPNGDPKYIKVNRKCHEVVRAGVISFGKRFTPKLIFQNLKKINDDIQSIVLYINSAVELVHSIIINKTKINKGVCPFQIDICFAVGPPKNTENKDAGLEDGSDDDDDEEEENKDYVDHIDDIKKKLEKNDLSYKHDKHEPNLDNTARVLIDLFVKHENEKIKDNKQDYVYPYRKRFVVMIDRRESKNKSGVEDDVYLYDPPKGKYTRDMPEENLLPHWGFAAARTCLLPNTEYDEKDAVASDKEKADKPKTPPNDTNIGSNNHCKGQIMTLSFQVKAEDEIKLYLFWNGNMIRFMPQDIQTVLQTLFVETEQNKSYLEDKSGELKQLIEDMKSKIVDKKFEKFRKTYMTARNH